MRLKFDVCFFSIVVVVVVVSFFSLFTFDFFPIVVAAGCSYLLLYGVLVSFFCHYIILLYFVKDARAKNRYLCLSYGRQRCIGP